MIKNKNVFFPGYFQYSTGTYSRSTPTGLSNHLEFLWGTTDYVYLIDFKVLYLGIFLWCKFILYY